MAQSNNLYSGTYDPQPYVYNNSYYANGYPYYVYYPQWIPSQPAKCPGCGRCNTCGHTPTPVEPIYKQS